MKFYSEKIKMFFIEFLWHFNRETYSSVKNSESTNMLKLMLMLWIKFHISCYSCGPRDMIGRKYQFCAFLFVAPAIIKQQNN